MKLNWSWVLLVRDFHGEEAADSTEHFEGSTARPDAGNDRGISV